MRIAETQFSTCMVCFLIINLFSIFYIIYYQIIWIKDNRSSTQAQRGRSNSTKRKSIDRDMNDGNKQTKLPNDNAIRLCRPESPTPSSENKTHFTLNKNQII